MRFTALARKAPPLGPRLQPTDLGDARGYLRLRGLGQPSPRSVGSPFPLFTAARLVARPPRQAPAVAVPVPRWTAPRSVEACRRCSRRRGRLPALLGRPRLSLSPSLVDRAPRSAQACRRCSRRCGPLPALPGRPCLRCPRSWTAVPAVSRSPFPLFTAVRPNACPPRQAPGRPCPRSPADRPHGLPKPVAAPSTTWPVTCPPAGPGRLRFWQVLPGLPETEIAAPLRKMAVHLPSPAGLGPLHLSPGKPSPRPAGTRRGSPPRPGRAPAANRHPTSSIAPAMCPRASSRAGVTPRTPLPYATSPNFFLDAPSGTPLPLPSRPPARAPLTRIGGFFFAPVRRAGTARGSSGGEFTWKCVPAWSRRPCCPRAETGPC